ncbi:hypothetical protein D9757_013740 [Collybiopsis confluens]|uniref:Uncharacterized protein n=1 Tax=Collybiopsis confluens TaxID=2823264 RepID=A0A8H5FVX7_9AGAR|nr:hypothetical protein D9757_013740 [Collybiopsis confluens]
MSYISNPRALEHMFYPLYEVSFRDLLRPIPASHGSHLVVAGQQHLWFGATRIVPKNEPAQVRRARQKVDSMRSKLEIDPEVGEDEGADTGAEEGEVIEGEVIEEEEEEEEDKLHIDHDEVEFWDGSDSDSEGTVEPDEDDTKSTDSEQGQAGAEELATNVNLDADERSIYSATRSIGSIQGIKRGFVDKIPDGVVATVRITTMSAPPMLSLPLRDCGDDDERACRKTYCNYVHSGGQIVTSYIPDSITELKRAPRRYLTDRKLYSQVTFAAFFRDASNKIQSAAEQMADYSVIFFKKYVDAACFLAVVGAGPFWRYAIIKREDSPWNEPGQPPRGKDRNAALKKFQALFGTNFFEMGTIRSDEEWDVIRRKYLMSEEAASESAEGGTGQI